MNLSKISLTTALISGILISGCTSLETKLPIPTRILVRMPDTRNYFEEIVSLEYDCDDKGKQTIIIRYYNDPETNARVMSTATRKGRTKPFMALYSNKEKPAKVDNGIGKNNISEDGYVDSDIFLRDSDAFTTEFIEVCKHIPKTSISEESSLL